MATSVLSGIAIALALALWQFRAKQAVLTQVLRDDAFAIDPVVSPDGNLLAYASDRGKKGNLNIWIHRLGPEGSDRQLTFDDIDAHEPAFSADSSRVAYRSERSGGGVFVVPIRGGEPMLLADEGRSPRFSPDGRWVAFWRGTLQGSLPNGSPWGAVYVAPSGGGDSKRVGVDLPWAGDPIWSPDSKYVLVYAQKDVDPVDLNADWWAVPVMGGPSIKTGIIPYLLHHGFPFVYSNGIPRAVHWTPTSIFFAADHGDSTNLWKIDFILKIRLISTLRRVTSSTNSDMSPSIAPNGTAYFASVDRRIGIWRLSIDPESGRIKGQPERISSTVVPEIYASSSLDGRKLASIRLQSGHTQAWVHNIATHLQLPLNPTLEQDQWSARISRDGQWVSYATTRPASRLYIVPSSGGISVVAAEHCAWAWDWSRDDTTLLVRKPPPDPAVYRLDLKSHTITPFLSYGRLRLTESRYSPDDQWVIFDVNPNDPTTGPVTQVRLMIAPVRDRRPGLPDTWIRVGHKTGWDNHPSWSPSGNRIYFVSDEDGFRCIWTQVLDPMTKRPLTPPMVVQHFHQTRASLLNVGAAELNLAVAKDMLFFEMGELTGGIWSIGAAR